MSESQKSFSRDDYEAEVYKLVGAIGAIATAYNCANKDDIVTNANACLECARSIAQSLDLNIKEPEINDVEFYKFPWELKTMMLDGVGLLGQGTLSNTKSRLESIIESALTIRSKTIS